ncbi:S26 family signal peptidase [Haloferax mediterranei ATCC 33500]|uniref:Peptidase n=1 Tax=Haloferax mediterranei (strain ATCC 33500 / DSM 1411 / JCM 8866 / NBRC 14739 / NCIMB 2177 / R-4) TaxID=523841 RepID=I3R7T9_HALMT|nr:S26 family signal peptidase [Haloferax mediterranei]AFK20299.1 signal sequence peptidase [Haloferax mediterranei ATCC 33500]AHZ23668.1 peptidase [Haloferax mediterranei ATCC 33500]ELZ99155.1 signal sequence peptidase [Haloferax mediterranei ATCC 33500]MDX5986946.1 S26 family signal peptidase [Haloferax mediterranei ATCC 33500]QCQ76265.1 S26 family signal peptidase [Haloferax mediterranei ATCC 33500]
MSADSPSSARLYAKDVAETIAVVAAVGAILFAVTGVWPPMVAVESPSMEPHLERGDLVLVTDEGRYAGPAADTNNIITANESEGYGRIGGRGDVIVYKQPSRTDSPIIHRAVFHVQKDENWYDKANKSYVLGADSCSELQNCPAPHAGYITRGDNNGYYDQANDIAPPVRPKWIRAKAQFHVPYLGSIRLELQKLA